MHADRPRGRPRHRSALFAALAAAGCATPAHFGDAAVERDAWVDAAPLADGDAAALDVSRPDAHAVGVLRLVAPLSTSYLAGRAPTLRWTGGEDASQIEVQLCADRPCAMQVRTLACAPTGACAVGAPLDPGVYFWRARAERSVVSSDAWTPTWQFRVKHTALLDGGPVGMTLDLDGDGRDDVVYADQAHSLAGETLWLRYGANIDAPVTLTIAASAGDDDYAPLIATGGDLNGDGLGDLLLGLRYDDSVTPPTAYWQWYRGGVAGLLPVASERFGSPSPSSMPVTGPRTAAVFEAPIGAGDVDGDGYGDVVIAAPSVLDDGSIGGGCLYLYRGGPLGPVPTNGRAWCDHGAGVESQRYGVTVAAGGDFDGDGFADAVVASGSGLVRMRQYFGGPTGFDRQADVTLPALSPCPTATMPGDVNGDGYSDFALCAETPGAEEATYLFLGGPGGLARAPASRSAITVQIIAGTRDLSGFSAGGDLDGDGYDDLVIGSPFARNGPLGVGVESGLVAVFAGSSTGLASAPRLVLYGPDGWLGRFGNNLAIPGDVDGDGLADLVAAAPSASTALPDLNYAGSVYLFRGPVTTTDTAPVRVWHGDAGASLGTSVTAGAL